MVIAVLFLSFDHYKPLEFISSTQVWLALSSEPYCISLSPGKKNGGKIVEGAVKPEDQKDKEGVCNPSVPSSDQNQETVETQKSPLPAASAEEANAKPAQKKMVKAKRGPRKK